MSLIACESCEKDISPNATSCPHCGEPIGIKKGNSFLSTMARIQPLVTPLLIAIVGGAFTYHQYTKDQEWLKQQKASDEARQKADRAVQLLSYLVSDKPGEKKLSVFLSLAFASQNQLSEGVIPVLVKACQDEEDKTLIAELKYALIELSGEAERLRGKQSDNDLGDRVGEAIEALFETRSIALIQASPSERIYAFDQILKLLDGANTQAKKAAALKAFEEGIEIIRRSRSVEPEEKDAILANLGKWLQKNERLRAENTISRADVFIEMGHISPEERRKMYDAAGFVIDDVQVVTCHSSQSDMAKRIGRKLRRWTPDFQPIEGKLNQYTPPVIEIRYLQDGFDSVLLETIKKVVEETSGMEARTKGLGEELIAGGIVEVFFPRPKPDSQSDE